MIAPKALGFFSHMRCAARYRAARCNNKYSNVWTDL